ncbi:MAG: hypothetical protein ACKVP0_02935 [Pirellulaceae bacterium]
MSTNDMNNDLKQLELATSRLLEQDLDGETAELREGWRVLASALEKSGEPFEEGALVAKLQREMAASSSAIETKRAGSGWIVVAALLGGTLAASLLLMVALAGGFFGPQPIAKPTKTVTPPNNLATKSNTNPAIVQENPFRGINENDGQVWNWDDALDSQISVAAAQMQTFQKPALPLDASISTLNYQLQQMAEDMDEGAL